MRVQGVGRGVVDINWVISSYLHFVDKEAAAALVESRNKARLLFWAALTVIKIQFNYWLELLIFFYIIMSW